MYIYIYIKSNIYTFEKCVLLCQYSNAYNSLMFEGTLAIHFIISNCDESFGQLILS